MDEESDAKNGESSSRQKELAEIQKEGDNGKSFVLNVDAPAFKPAIRCAQWSGGLCSPFSRKSGYIGQDGFRAVLSRGNTQPRPILGRKENFAPPAEESSPCNEVEATPDTSSISWELMRKVRRMQRIQAAMGNRRIVAEPGSSDNQKPTEANELRDCFDTDTDVE